ncbi:unnamed protein product, partial [marine sediment metagenome]
LRDDVKGHHRLAGTGGRAQRPEIFSQHFIHSNFLKGFEPAVEGKIQRFEPAPLIIVHTKELAGQWVDRIGTFLGIESEDVGFIGSGQKRIGEKITVALVQSLYKCADEVAENIGFLLVDECHRCPSRTFTEAVSYFDSQYM